MVYWYTMEKVGKGKDKEVVVIRHEHEAFFETAKEARDYVKKSMDRQN